jgi:hypothetical protein
VAANVGSASKRKESGQNDATGTPSAPPAFSRAPGVLARLPAFSRASRRFSALIFRWQVGPKRLL